MVERKDRTPAHDEEIRGQFAIQRRLTAMEAEEREMERAMRAFEEDADQAKRYIKAEWRREHWGHEPERPPAWESTDTTHVTAPPRRPRRFGLWRRPHSPARGRPPSPEAR